MDPSHKVLIVSYHFPPDSSVGGLRLAKFARLLPDFGWQPFVLTARETHPGETMDPERLRGLEKVRIVRTTEPRSLLSELVGARARAKQTIGRETVSAHVAHESHDEGITRTIRRHVLSVLLSPDDKKKWAVRATLRAARLIRQHKIDCILTSGPPMSLHLVGLVAKVLTNVTWLADFRDPWLESLDARPSRVRSKAADALERHMEAVVVRYADKVITTTSALREALGVRYPSCPTGKLVCVPNSIDTERIQPDAGLKKYVPLTITYMGTLYEGRTPEPLFQAVSGLIADGKILATDIRIKLIGHCRDIDGVETTQVVERHGLGSVVEVVDSVPYSESIRIMQRSHLLLILAPAHHRLIVPAKFYDYLGSGSAILAVAEPGATTDLVSETRSGWCFSHDDVDGLRQFLLQLIHEGSFARLRNNVDSFQRFGARHLTGRLAAEMSSLANPGSCAA